MLKDIPYSVLMQDKRAYEIMLLRDQYDNTFTDIAKEFEISVVRAVQIYRKQKFRQKSLYITHISIALGHGSTAQVRKIFDEAYECYQDTAYACAYFEKKYKGILTEYRDGEPGMPIKFLKNMPPFKPQLSKKTVACIVEMREVEKASFATIAKELRMTRAKAKRTYELFYHKKVMALIEALLEKATSSEEKRAIWDGCFKGNKSSKRRYDMLIEEQATND
ncbi:hypothetical protein AAEU42_09585 [Pseudoflavonifractor phocaeensis]|uniref:hypothetical protein n=1 Tax=Pseudoflavonifractor phocaeensis TaxID=1870988 RepID=UPI00313E1890